MSRAKSILEPYKDEIKELLDMGCTHQFITDELNRKYGINATKPNVVYFCRTRELKSKVTSGSHNRVNIPVCLNCDECSFVKAPFHMTRMYRLCDIEMVLIETKVTTSPLWCPKREIRSEI